MNKLRQFTFQMRKILKSAVFNRRLLKLILRLTLNLSVVWRAEGKVDKLGCAGVCCTGCEQSKLKTYTVFSVYILSLYVLSLNTKNVSLFVFSAILFYVKLFCRYCYVLLSLVSNVFA